MKSRISFPQKNPQIVRVKPRFSYLLTIALLIAACSPTPVVPARKEEKKPAVAAPQLVGRIATVPPDKRFVLIQSYGPWKVESGSVLTTRGADNRAANLRTTGETMGDFAAADFQSGNLQVGDAVYFQSFAKPQIEPTTSEATKNQRPTIKSDLEKNN